VIVLPVALRFSWYW